METNITAIHTFANLSQIEQHRIRRKRQRMLDEGWYGKPINAELDRYLGDEKFWVAREHWWAPEEVMERLMDEFMEEDGAPDWGAIQEHLDSGEEDESFLTYADPGDPQDVVHIDWEFQPPFPITYIKTTFEVIEGGRSDDA